jgi:hypothetical protein
VLRPHGPALVTPLRILVFALPIAAASLLHAATPAPAPAPDVDQQFAQTVKPFVGKYCVTCHSGKMAPAQFDLKSYTTMNMVTDDFPRWALLAERLKNKEMPPKPMPAPPAAEAQQIIDWVAAVRAEEIRKADGDPGIVMARRLSNAEYDYTIRDLTGQDMQVARQFPVDPANQAGFDNSGESLTMSSALLNKYLKAASQVADHAVLKPDGIEFAPYPALVETDREKYAIQRILAFYAAQPTDYAAYFEAAWRYQYRRALKKPHATLASTAADAHVSPKYLPMVWGILHDQHAVGPVLKLQQMYLALPNPKGAQPGGQAKALQTQVDQNPHPHRHAVRRARRERPASAIRAPAELEAEAVRREPAHERPQGSAQRHRSCACGARDSEIPRSAPGSRAPLGRSLRPGPRQRRRPDRAPRAAQPV